MTFDQVELEYFRALAARHTVLADAAEESGLSRHSLARRMKRLGLSLAMFAEEHDFTKGEPGKVSSYNYGCRCKECKAARSAYQAAWYKKRPARKKPIGKPEPETVYDHAYAAALREFSVSVSYHASKKDLATRARWALWMAMEDLGMTCEDMSEIHLFRTEYHATSIKKGLNRGRRLLGKRVMGRMVRAKAAALKIIQVAAIAA